jgi:ubiquinol-cytochrome c reductase cytochrome c1 subunit
MRTAAMLLARLCLSITLAAPLAAAAAEGGPLDRLPANVNPNDLVSLQRGAHAYINYCMGCHSVAFMRYSKLQEFGLSEKQVRDNLIFTGAKVGEPMKTGVDPRESKEWFGAAPPDLSVIARSRSSHAGSGADWLYTYLRSFYRDSSRPTGWNNTVYPNVGMPHVLWQLQGVQALKTEEVFIPAGSGKKEDARRTEVQKLVLEKPGTIKSADYDRMVADLVNFLVYVGEPARQLRIDLGMWILMVLAVLIVLSYLIKKEYWKDVH